MSHIENNKYWCIKWQSNYFAVRADDSTNNKQTTKQQKIEPTIEYDVIEEKHSFICQFNSVSKF